MQLPSCWILKKATSKKENDATLFFEQKVSRILRDYERMKTRRFKKSDFVFVRWLGAFRSQNQTLEESLNFEAGFSISSTRRLQVACEAIKIRSYRSYDWDSKRDFNSVAIEKEICRCGIGLLVKRNKVRKIFAGDVWSEIDEEGNLFPTRLPNLEGHWEAFADAKNYIKKILIVKEYCSEETIKTVFDWAEKNGFEVEEFSKFEKSLEKFRI